MKRKSNEGQAAIRLQFNLDRDENPRLFDDLIRFKAGTKRINRLRHLAHDGLLLERSGDRCAIGGRTSSRGPDPSAAISDASNLAVHPSSSSDEFELPDDVLTATDFSEL